jgi:hypothetical protein
MSTIKKIVINFRFAVVLEVAIDNNELAVENYAYKILFRNNYSGV